MTTTWWWVRHGPTHEKSFVGWRDVPADLSDQGQIDRLHAYLPEDALVISSDLSRATATADAISSGRTRLPHSVALREFNFGAWDGLRFDQVALRDPELSRTFWESPGDIAPPNGESWNDVATRITPVVEAMNNRYHGRHIIAVAHIGVIMTQIQMAQRSSPTQALGYQIDNFSVTKLVWDAEKWAVDCINHVT